MTTKRYRRFTRVSIADFRAFMHDIKDGDPVAVDSFKDTADLLRRAQAENPRVTISETTENEVVFILS